jgi:hypothetical protein
LQVHTGLSDGTHVEVLAAVSGELSEGKAVVIGEGTSPSDDEGGSPTVPKSFDGKKKADQE